MITYFPENIIQAEADDTNGDSSGSTNFLLHTLFSYMLFYGDDCMKINLSFLASVKILVGM